MLLMQVNISYLLFIFTVIVVLPYLIQFFITRRQLKIFEEKLGIYEETGKYVGIGMQQLKTGRLSFKTCVVLMAADESGKVLKAEKFIPKFFGGVYSDIDEVRDLNVEGLTEMPLSIENVEERVFRMALKEAAEQIIEKMKAPEGEEVRDT
ncbi:MAG: transcriptional regulator GutM [Candidatus Asgardarchaeia archaeon]